MMLSNGLCDNSSSIVQQLREKHPCEEEYKIVYPDPTPIQISADVLDVKSAITRIKRTKAPGLDGWRPFFWKPILGYCFEDRIIKKLTILINRIFRGVFNRILGPNFSISRGVPIAKDPSKKNVRPIAIGLSFRRICTSIINRKLNNKITNIMSSMNLGNSRNGIPIFVHLMRNLLDFKELNNDKNFSVIEFDVHNAFNDIKRKFMRKVCLKYVPSIIKYFDLTYAKHSSIFFPNNLIISSQRGFQQGDGLSVMFALCLFHLFHDENNYKNMYFFKFFHDDGRCMVPLSDVGKTLVFVQSKLKTVGLKLNLKKSKVYVDESNLEKVEHVKKKFGIQICLGFNFEILGSFVGSLQKTKVWLNEKLLKYKKFLDLLHHFDHKQSMWRVLSYFTGYSKFQNLIRTIPRKFLQDFILEIDRLVTNSVSKIVEAPLDSYQLIQVSLPISFGGLGVLCLKTFSLAIKSALWNQIHGDLVSELVEKRKFFNISVFNLLNTEYFHVQKDFLSATTRLSEEEISAISWSNQKFLVQEIAKKEWTKIYSVSTSNYHKARLLGCRAKAASGWIFSSAAPYTRLNNDEFCIIASFWLGIPLVHEFTKCRYCGVTVDKFGAHTITCNKGGSLVKRHNYIRNFLYRKCKQAGYMCELEKKHIDSVDGKKPADIWIQHLFNNKPTAVDISVTSPTQVVMVKDCKKEVFAAANLVIGRKKKKYASVIEKGEIEFLPFVLEAYGGISNEAMKFLKRLSSDLRGHVRKVESVIISNLMKCLTIRIWKSNVEAFNLRTFSVKPLI